MLAHCRSAKARSAALLLGFMCRHLGPGSEQTCLEWLLRIQPRAAPNIVIVQHADDFLGSHLVQAVESHPGITERCAEAERARQHQIESRGLAAPGLR
jgi:predicted protein tyrosine phosphatase